MWCDVISAAQKSEAVLPSSKPNIREILWQSMQLRNVESRLVEGNIRLSGEILVSILYNDEEEGEASVLV